MEMIKTIDGLQSSEYEHPWDKKALDVLQSTRGIDSLIKKFNELGVEKLCRLEFTGESLRVTSSSFPIIYEVLEDVCDTLSLRDTPEIYLRRNEDFYFSGLTSLQGITVGTEKPIIVLSQECLECYQREELSFILGREVGRIKSNHILYQDVGRMLPILGGVISAATLGFDTPVMSGLNFALTQWLRMSDYTVDRAGLLACQNAEVAMLVLAKIAGLPFDRAKIFNLDDFKNQAREFNDFEEGNYAKILKKIDVAMRSNAYTIARAHELDCWIESGDYQDVINRETEHLQTPKLKFCRHCGFELGESYAFCPSCGGKI